jgi:outer membrane lipoprotein-sorting protein
MANKLNTATTLHGIFNLSLAGQTINGTVNTEVWNATPNKNRTVVLQSSISQLTTGTVNVTDGKQQWQYDPTQKVVYTGPATLPTTTGTPGARTPTSGTGGQGNQSLFLLNLVQGVFTQSDGTLKSSSDIVNGHNVYDIGVVPSTGRASTGGPANFDYTGDVYIDKTTQQPVQVKLNIQGIGNVVLDIPTLELNQSIPASTFTFVAPAGVKVLPLSQLTPTAGAGTGTLTLAQAQQQAGYHLLSIPADQTDYALNGVNALGAPGNQTYTLNYMKGNATITIAEGKPLANLPASGQSVTLRGTTATISSVGGNTTLAWTEKGVGIRISSSLSSDQVESIAKSLA